MRHVFTIALAFGFASVGGCVQTASIAPERRTVALSNYDSPAVSVVCELRYYLVGHVTSLAPTNGLQVVRNVGTNLICSVAEPLRLIQRADTNLLWEIGGFVFQIVEPQEYAGQVLTAHFDGPLASGDPFKAFAPARRYRIDVSQKFIGRTNFGICY
jgi:hypothetical protein